MMSGAEDAQSHALVLHGDTEHPRDLRMEGQSGSSEGSVINGAAGQPLVVFPDAGTSGRDIATGHAPQFFMHRPEFHWHHHVEGAVDHAARQVIARLGHDAHVFSNDTIGRVHALEHAHGELQKSLQEKWRSDLQQAVLDIQRKHSLSMQDVAKTTMQPLLQRIRHLEYQQKQHGELEQRLQKLEATVDSLSRTVFGTVAELETCRTSCDGRKEAHENVHETFSTRITTLEMQLEDLNKPVAWQKEAGGPSTSGHQAGPRQDSAASMLPAPIAVEGKVWEGTIVNRSQTVVQEAPTLALATPQYPPRQYTATGERIPVSGGNVPGGQEQGALALHPVIPGWGENMGGGPGGGAPGGSSHGGGSGGQHPDGRSHAGDISPPPIEPLEEPHERGWKPTIKVDSPAEYNGKDGPTAIPWFTAVERWLKLSRVPGSLWFEYTATRMTGGAQIWMNSQLEKAARANHQPWNTWEDFKQDVCKMFEPQNREEKARSSLRALTQTGSVKNYVYKFDQLMAQTETVNESEAYSLFVKGLQPELKREIGIWVDVDDLDKAKQVALRAEVYSAPPQKNEQSGSQKGGFRRRRGGFVGNVDGDEDKGKKNKDKKGRKEKMMTEDEVNALVSQKKKQWEKDRNRAENERNRERNERARRDRDGQGSGQGQDRRYRGACYWCQGPHHVAQCPVIKQLKDAAQGGPSTSSGNA